jgi:4'-phosphopantetheinyl transferase
MMSEDERCRYGRLAMQAPRILHVCARVLTRVVLGRLLNCAPAAVRFDRSPNGKPRLAGDNPSDIRFNLAHSGTTLLLAATYGAEIGVDIEDMSRPPVSMLQVARHVFSPAECVALETAPEETRKCVFFRTWTLKEAYIKATGEGLAANLRAFWFHFFNNEAIMESAASDIRACKWRFRHGPFGDRCRFALAVRTEQPVDIEWINTYDMVVNAVSRDMGNAAAAGLRVHSVG